MFGETELLEASAYDDWLALWDNECYYWAPFQQSVTKPASVVNLIYDDKARLTDRVRRLTSGDAHSQDPPSVTSRMLGPVRPWSGGSWQPDLEFGPVLETRFVTTELRRGMRRQYAGKATYWLREADGSYRIVGKRVDLLEALGPLGNLTILL